MAYSSVRDLVSFLESYRGHDAAIGLGSYVCTFVAGSSPAPWAEKLRVVSKEFRACRVILRLFDDASMLVYCLSYGLGSQEKNSVLRVLQVISNIADTLYYPVEHLAWFGDKKVLPLRTPLLHLSGLLLWMISLTAGFLKSVLHIYRLHLEIQRVKKQRYLEKSERSADNTEQNQQIRADLQQLKGEQLTQTLQLICCVADFTNAIHWMPPGILWAGKLSARQSGFLGTISSLIQCYRKWPRKPASS